MFKRKLEKQFMKAVQMFPVIILTGARQTGKSTLCRTMLKDTHGYVSLEDPDARQQALEDPRTFLKRYAAPVIIDEIQYAPNLVSYIQGIVDENRQSYGQYVLTGSQNFLLMRQVSQSLAGRAALLTLYPCSVNEVDEENHGPRSSLHDVADWILRGGYPELRARSELDRKAWCSAYIRLYLERDVRNLLNIGDLTAFERFIRLVALRTAQILNISDLARDAEVSPPTAKRWLSILEESYIIYMLHPYHANLSKRLIKAPKIYFTDTALASYLMGIHHDESLMDGPQLGPLFETSVIMEHLKHDSFSGNSATFTYFRTKDGLEVDLFIEDENRLFAREIKTTRTPMSRMAENLIQVEKLLKKPLDKILLTPIDKAAPLSQDVMMRPWQQVEWS